MCIVQHVEMKSLFTFYPIKRKVSATVKSANPAATFRIFLLKRQKPTIVLFVLLAVMVDIVFKKNESRLQKKPFPYLKNHSANLNQAHLKLNQKRHKVFHLWHSLVDTQLVDTVNHNFIYILIFYTFSQHQSNMIFSVSNDGFEWSLDFRPDSVTLTVKDLVHEKTRTSPKIPLAAWSLLLSQRQEFLNNHLARVPVTPNQQGTHELKDDVLSSVGA